MHYLRLTFLFGLFLFSHHSFSSSITVNEPFELLKVDGNDYQTNFFNTNSKVDLIIGRHVLLLEYNELFDDVENDDHTKVKSAPFIAIFEVTADNQQLVLRHTKLKSIKSARSFAEAPQVSIVNRVDDSIIDAKVLLLSEFEQQQFQAAVASTHIDVKESSQSKVKVSKPTSLTHAIIPAQNSLSNTPDKTSRSAPKSRAYEMMLYWWAEASDEDKKRFVSELNKQGVTNE